MPTMTPPPKPPKKSSITFKKAAAIIGILLFLVVASVGVFISQRQQQVSGPVAPSAPTSKPSADVAEPNNCQLTFTVDAPSGVASCTSKTAFSFEDDSIIPFTDNAQLARGAEFFYQTSFEAAQITAGNVLFSDLLDANLEFVQDVQNTADLKVSTDATTNRVLVTKSYGQMQPNQKEKVVFKVRVKTDAVIDKLNNIATITTEGAADNTSSCNFQANIVAVGDAVCISKEAYRLTANNTPGTKIAAGEDVSPGEKFLYRILVSSTEETSDEVIVTDQLPSKIIFDDSNLDSTTASADNMVVTSLGVLKDNSQVTIDLYVHVDAAAQSGAVNNTASVLTGDEDASPSNCSIALNVPETSCNSDCTTDAQCPSNLSCESNKCRLESNPTNTQCQPAEASPTPTPTPAPGCNETCSTNADCSNSSLVCYTAADGKKCRLESNPTSTQCLTAQQVTPTPTPTPTPAPGCNDKCTTNADCSNSEHICYTTAAGNVCRLAENVESNTCTMPGSQPDLPTALPETGPADWMIWLKTGLVTLGLGAILLLLL